MAPKKMDRRTAAENPAAIVAVAQNLTAVRSLVTCPQDRLPDGYSLRCGTTELHCVQEGASAFKWAVKQIGATTPDPSPLTSLADSTATERGYAAFVSPSVVALVQRQLLRLFSVPDGELLATEDIGYLAEPTLIGTYLLFKGNDGDYDGENDLTVYDLSQTYRGADKRRLKSIPKVKWERRSTGKGISGRVRKKRRGEQQEDDGCVEPGLPVEEDDESHEDPKMEDPHRAYPDWGVAELGDGWLATMPAGDEAPNRHGPQTINVYCLQDTPHRFCDIPALQGDVIAIFKRGHILCVCYEQGEEDFWDLRNRRYIKYISTDQLEPFRTPDYLGAFRAAPGLNLLKAVKHGDIARVKHLIESEGANINTRGQDPQAYDNVDTCNHRRPAQRHGPDSKGPTALSFAVAQTDVGLVRYLLSKGASTECLYASADWNTPKGTTSGIEALAQELPDSTSKRLICRMLQRAVSVSAGRGDAGVESEEELEAAAASSRCEIEREAALRAVYTVLNHEGPAKKKGPQIASLVKKARDLGANLLKDSLPEFSNLPIAQYASQCVDRSDLIPAMISAMFDSKEDLEAALVAPHNLLMLSSQLMKQLPKTSYEFYQAACKRDVVALRKSLADFKKSKSENTEKEVQQLARRWLLGITTGYRRLPIEIAIDSSDHVMLQFLVEEAGQTIFDERGETASKDGVQLLISGTRSLFPLHDAFYLAQARKEIDTADKAVTDETTIASWKQALRHARLLAAAHHQNAQVVREEFELAQNSSDAGPLDLEYQSNGSGYGVFTATALEMAVCSPLLKTSETVTLLVSLGAKAELSSSLCGAGYGPTAKRLPAVDVLQRQQHLGGAMHQELLNFFAEFRSPEQRLAEAIQKADLPTVCQLLHAGADANSVVVSLSGLTTPLQLALGTPVRNQLRVIPALIAAGADPFAAGSSVWCMPSLSTAPDVALALNPTSAAARKFSPLFAAIRRADPSLTAAALLPLSPEDVHAKMIIPAKTDGCPKDLVESPPPAAAYTGMSAFDFACSVYFSPTLLAVSRGADTAAADQEQMTSLGVDLVHETLRVLALVVAKARFPSFFPPPAANQDKHFYHTLFWRVLGPAEASSPHDPLLEAERSINSLRAQGALCALKVDELIELSKLSSNQFPAGLASYKDHFGRTAIEIVLSTQGRSADISRLLDSCAGNLWSAEEWVAAADRSKQIDPAVWCLIRARFPELLGSIKVPDMRLLVACAAGDVVSAKQLVESGGADVNCAAGPLCLQSWRTTPLALATPRSKELSLYLLSKGANPGAVGPDGHTILNALEQRLSYCFGSDGATELVELYLAMSRKVQDPQQVKRLLVNFGVRAPLRYHTSRNSRELPAAYFELLRDPLVSPESWESVLKACGVTDTAAKKLLTQACGVVLPLVQHAVMGHPRTLMAVLDLPKVTVTQTLIKQSRSYGCHNTPLLEARTKQEREAIFAKMMEVQNPSGRR